ncbi:FAD-dependent oxidoreductase [Candidatus Binatia bacterium]|nr:FAD-dependent oxidoreductase [Candidatus Binatia bacterium]
MSANRVVILGGGPAGLAAAWQLHARRRGTAVVLEQRDEVGGNAGSFEIDGIPVDFGSHRLHPACAPAILGDLRELLRDDLLERPRNGRIRLHGQWIGFPIRPADAVHLPPAFAAGVFLDALRKLAPRHPGRENDTFASVLESGLGRTICRDFYFPYAYKIWGVRPEMLSAIQARRRVSAGSIGKMLRKVAGAVPGLKPAGAGRFFYPRQGFGQISRALGEAARKAGAEVRLRARVRAVQVGAPHRLEVEVDGGVETIACDHLWSTIPITVLARLLKPAAPPPVLDAAARMTYRAMVLVYVVLGQRQFTPYDAHYFPGADLALTRLSEPKNYSARAEPTDRTVLCAEIPCSIDDTTWQATDAELAETIAQSLARCGIPIVAPVIGVVTRRLPQAYPIYLNGYEPHFECLDTWMRELPGVLTFGRQGLFAHDNTHHTIAMAYGAVDCMRSDGHFDRDRWRTYRVEFESHVVED